MRAAWSCSTGPAVPPGWGRSTCATPISRRRRSTHAWPRRICRRSAEDREPVRSEWRWGAVEVSVPFGAGRKTFAENLNEIELVAPTGFEPVFESRHVFARFYDVFGNASHEESRP